MIGRIKQIETCGLVDGPGIRIVIFMQGCPIRCIFCHNPEMWDIEGGIEYSAEQILDFILKYKNYFENGGGVTFSGGEPLTQPLFLIECLKLCKENDIHTCIDTSGVGNSKYFEEILKYTDLVIFDIKAINNNDYIKITGSNIEQSLNFLETCKKHNTKLWIRQVIISGINDTEEYIYQMSEFINKINNVEKIELLPYHTLGIEKYKSLNIQTKLEQTKPMDIEECKKLENLLISLMKK